MENLHYEMGIGSYADTDIYPAFLTQRHGSGGVLWSVHTNSILRISTLHNQRNLVCENTAALNMYIYILHVLISSIQQS